MEIKSPRINTTFLNNHASKLHIVSHKSPNNKRPIRSHASPRRSTAIRSSSPRQDNTTETSSIRPLDFVAFTLIIDDIVLWDGFTLMNQLGGGGPQSIFGFLAYHHAALATGSSTHLPHAGLAAGIGMNDFPIKWSDWLRLNGIDMNGLIVYDHMPTPRAWQIVEEDGRRHEIWRTGLQSSIQKEMLLPQFDALPISYQTAHSFHLGIDPNQPPIKLLHQLYTLTNTKSYILNEADDISVSVETFKTATKPLSSDEIKNIVQFCDIFSPNEAEAATMLGLVGEEYSTINPLQNSSLLNDIEPIRLTQPFIDAGAAYVALRRGEKGAIIHERRRNKIWYIPSYKDTIVLDTTGCGNAFCGAFLAAIRSGEDPGRAGAWASAVGSVMCEYRGIIDDRIGKTLSGRVLQRMEEIFEGVHLL